MNNYSARIIRGRKFSQNSLASNLQQVIGGQAAFFKFIVIFLAIGLLAISGCLAGFLGALIGLNILARCEKAPYFIIYSGVIFAVVTWAVETLRKGFSQGFMRVGLGAILALPILAAAAQFSGLRAIEIVEILAAFLLLTMIAVASALISLLTGSLCAALILILSARTREEIEKIYAFFLVVISILISWCLAPTLVAEGLCLPDSIAFGIVPIIGGALFGSGMASVSLLATQFKDQSPEKFAFFRSWAIALGAWGGTSFYNLDLSGVNLRAAQLANTDLRARKLYRTCLQSVTGLETARVNNQYLDLANPNVQKLLTQGNCKTQDFSRLNLRGAYLQGVDIRRGNFTDAYLTGADLQRADLRDSVWGRTQAADVDFRQADLRRAQLVDVNLAMSIFSGADLREAIFVRTQVVGVDFTGADLTGICIEDWRVNEHTNFTDVRCDYIFRKYQAGVPTNRYPADRNFEPQEFQSLYQEIENVAELIFKEGVNWSAFSFSFQKLEVEEDGLELQLKGFERRGDLWVVKVTHNPHVPTPAVEQRLVGMYEEMKGLLAAKEEQIHKLLGIAADQAESIKELSQQPFGNSFFITGSTITNLTGSGQIDYAEAAGQVRNIVAHSDNPTQASSTLQSFLAQLQTQSVATTSPAQAELIQQVMLTEAEKDAVFKQYLLQQGSEICQSIASSPIAQAIQGAIAQLQPH